MRRPRSKACGKVCFRTEIDAQLALIDIEKKRSRMRRDGQRMIRRAECRYYSCKRCGWWHLTSMKLGEGVTQ